MNIVSSFTEVDIIKIRNKETLFLIKKGEPSFENCKHVYFKIYLTVKDIKKLYKYIKEAGLW